MSIRAERASGPEGAAGTAPGFGWEFGLLAAGSAALLVAPFLPLVDPDTADPAFDSAPLLVALAVLPVAVALALLLAGLRTAALGLVVGLGALAPGRAFADAQLVSDANRAPRPELLLPDSLTAPDADIGVVALLVGNGLLLVAAIVAVVRWTSRTEATGAVAGMEFDGTVDRRPGRQGLLAAVLCLGAVAGVGLLAAPLHSDNPYLVGESALDAPAWTTTGGVVLAVLTPVVGWLLASSPDPARAAGGVLGVALAVLAVAAPPLAAVVLEDDITFAWGPVVALCAVVAMVTWAVVSARRPDPGPAQAEAGGAPALPATGVLHRVAGAVAVLAGAAAFGGWAFDAINGSDGLDAPSVGASRLLVPVALLVGVLGAAVLVAGRRAGALRPVLTVALVTVPMAAAPVLDAGLTARDYSGLEVGAGSWLSLAAMPVAGLAAVFAAVAGGVERDDVDLSSLADRGQDRPVLVVAVLAAAASMLAFVVPLADAPGYDAVAVGYGNGIASWGPVVAMLAVLAAVALAPRCRPSRAAALFVGAALVLAIRLAQYGLVEERVDGAEVDLGVWFAVAALALTVLGAGVAVRRGGRLRPAGGRGEDG